MPPVKKTIDKAADAASALGKKDLKKQLLAEANAKADEDAKKIAEKKQISNMITTLKNGAQSPERAATLNYYKSLGHFDKEKKTILERFYLDKSCKWFTQYYEEKIKSDEVKDTSLRGFGTK